MQLFSFTVLSTSFLALFASADHWDNFENFIERFNKKYNSIKEFETRFEIYRDNMKYGIAENAFNNSYTLG